MIEQETFEGIIDAELGHMDIASGTSRATLIGLARRFKDLFIIGSTFREPSQLFALCDAIDAEPSLSPPTHLRDISFRLRQRILHTLLRAHFQSRCAEEVQHTDAKAADRIHRDYAIAEQVALMLPVLRAEAPPVFDQHWLKLRFTENISIIEQLLKNSQTGVETWEPIAKLLPPSLRERFRIDSRATQSTHLVQRLKEMKCIAAKLGPEAVAQLLISAGIIKGGFDTAMRIISPYLGRCATADPDFVDITRMPEAILKYQDIVQLLFLKLRNYVYRKLAERESQLAASGQKLTEDAYDAFMSALRNEVQTIIRQHLQDDPDAPIESHQHLFEHVIQYFEHIGNISAPARMVEQLVTQSGTYPFPSMRQRIAMHEVSAKQRQLIGFDMGLGKTETAFLCKEYVNAKKMLFVCLTGMEEEIAGRITRDYMPEKSPCYRNGCEPTVSIIRAGISPEELQKALQAEVVICPYSMLCTRRNIGGSNIVEHLQNHGTSGADDVKECAFDFLALDEVAKARKVEGAWTTAVHDIATGVPRLYEDGYIVSLSGEPVPNKPEDIVPQLRLWDRENYGNMRSLRKKVRHTDPLAVRNALFNYLLILDEPDDWEQYVTNKEFDLYPEERLLYNAIVADDDLTVGGKMHLLQLCILNAPLLSGGQNVRSKLFEELTDQLDAYLAEPGIGTVMIGENMNKQGITRPHSRCPDASGTTLSERLKKYLSEKYGSAVRLRAIDGDTPKNPTQPLRTKYLRESLVSQQAADDGMLPGNDGNTTPKTVLFVHVDCVREGRNLSHIHRVITLETDYNKPDTAQFVKRFVREGNTDLRMTCLIARNTVSEGIRDNAELKNGVISALKNGGTFTDNDLALFDAEKVAKNQLGADFTITFCSPLMRFIISPAEKLRRMLIYGSSGRTATALEQFFAEFGSEFAKLYCDRWDTSYSGNNSRFAAGLIRRLEKEEILSGNRIADLGCGPLGLEQTLGCSNDGKVHHISSVDLCGEMLEFGLQMIAQHRKKDFYEPHYYRKGSMHDLHVLDAEHFSDGSFNAINCANALHWTKLGKRRQKKESKQHDQRVHTLMEFNRILAPGGILLLTFPPKRFTTEQYSNFTESALPRFGFRILPQYSGEGSSIVTDDRGNHFTNITITCQKTRGIDLRDIAELELKHLEISKDVDRSPRGPRRKDPPKPKPKLHTGYRHTDFILNRERFSFDANEEKRRKQAEKLQSLTQDIAYLRALYIRRGRSFSSFTPEEISELSARGIRHISVESEGATPHRFILPAAPDQYHDPLDEGTWGSIERQLDEDGASK